MASFHDDKLVVVLLAVLLAAALMSGGPTSAVEAHNPFISAAMGGKGQQARALRAGDRMLHEGCSACSKNGKMCCSGNCVDVSNDNKNCGACGTICAWGFSCCNGRCANLNTDPSNCGAVGHRCHAGVKCSFGMCGY